MKWKINVQKTALPYFRWTYQSAVLLNFYQLGRSELDINPVVLDGHLV